MDTRHLKTTRAELLLQAQVEIEEIGRVSKLLTNFVQELRQMPEHMHQHEIELAEKKLRSLEFLRSDLQKTLTKLKGELQ